MKSRKMSFYKEVDGSWFAVIPEWEGDRAALEMVMGADVLLDIINMNYDNTGVVNINIVFDESKLNHERPNWKLTATTPEEIEEVDMSAGQWYMVESNEMSFPIWLCDVTKFVFGEFPKTIYFEL